MPQVNGHFCTGLFKVLSNKCMPQNGGMPIKYSLPTQNADGSSNPGDWMTRVWGVSCCSRGYHLTTSPGQWFKPKCRIFVAEGLGQMGTSGDKAAFEQVRLLEEVTETWPYLSLFPEVQIALIATGRTVWKQLRRLTYSNGKFRDGNFDELDGWGATFKGMALSKATFRNALLGSSEFDNCDLCAANFKKADLNRISFKKCNLYKADFSMATLANADFSAAHVTEVKFWRANMRGALIPKGFKDYMSRKQCKEVIFV